VKPTEFKSPGNLLLSFMRPHWKVLILTVALLWLQTALATIQPLAMAPMINIALEQTNIFASSEGVEPLSFSEVDLNNVDQYVSQLLNFGSMDAWDVVFLLSGAYLVIALLKTIVSTISFYLVTRIRVSTMRTMQAFVFGHLLTFSMDFFNARQSGALVSRLAEDTRSAANNLTGVITTLSTAPFMIAFYGFLLVRTNLTLMLIVTLIALAQWVVARFLRDRLRALVMGEFDLITQVNAYLQEIFQNIRVVKSFVAEQFEQLNLNRKIEEMVPAHISRALHRHWQDPLVTMINAIANVVILIFSARELFDGNLTIAGFFLFLYLGRSIIDPITRLGQTYLNIQEMEASTERIYEIISLEATIQDGDIVQKGLEEAIRFEGVSFAYGDARVLSDVNLEIKRGEMVALVGPSGAGKSTLTDLLMRFYDPTAGKIEIDGTNLRELNIESYRRLFGVVAQENLLFNETIANNIAYGREDVSVDRVKAAAEVANAAEFIEQTEDGYETMVGDRGIRLSGGQRQRIAIARAVVHEPQILIMDEATSSLDTESERLVQAAIDRVIQNTTAIVVAHRLSTVIHADKIIVLEEGRVLDQGKHEELFERCELYRHLCELQFRMSGDRDELLPEESVEGGEPS
jgi:subfamily B ATP-binding cassette protein MsbA